MHKGIELGSILASATNRCKQLCPRENICTFNFNNHCSRTSKQYVKKQWCQVCVGEFVMLSSNEEIPADVLLLYSSEPSKVCFIETASLDGETNLKQREVVETIDRESQVLVCQLMLTLASWLCLARQEDYYNPEDFVGELFFEPPKSKIYEFGGYM